MKLTDYIKKEEQEEKKETKTLKNPRK